MFGYVKAYKPEMKIKHYEEYKGVYCSLCRVLGKRYGVFARMTLSYDCTFLAMLRLCTDEEKPCFSQGRCPFNPVKKCNFCKDRDVELSFVADVSMIMLYYKIRDNINDGGFFKKLLMFLILPLFSLYHRRAKKYSPEIEEIISQMMYEQSKIEESKTGSIDEAAHCTAEAMEKILSLGFDSDKAKVLRRIGYLTGRWIYIADAVDDMESDRKSGSYNPLLINCKSREDGIQMLNLTASEICNAYELLEVKSFDAEIRNIIYDGFYNTALNIGGKKDEGSL